MDYRHLLPSQIQSLGKILAASQLDPSLFRWDHLDVDFAGYDPLPGILHTPTGYYFAFARHYQARGYDSVVDAGHRVGFSPGKESDSEDHGPLEWRDVEAFFGRWLQYLRRELDAKDFWEAVAGVKGVTGYDDSDLEETPFTPEERENLTNRLAEIQARLSSLESLRAQDIAFVKKQFGDLREELSRMRRGRWKKLFLGTLANLALRQIIPPELIRGALEALRDLFTAPGAGSLPPG